MNSNNQITALNLKEIIAKEPDNATFDFANQLAKSLSNIGLNSPQQTKAFKDLSILLTSDIKINSPIVVPLICGLGKTTFRTSYLISIINAIKHGIFAADKMHIIITADRIADLHKTADAVQKNCGYYYNDIPYVYVCHSWNKNNKCPNNVNSYAESLLTCNSENCKHYADNVCALANQLENQKKSPILAITNEKLGILLNQDKSEDGINQYCKFVDDDGVMHKRGMLLVDEKPQLLYNYKIDVSMLAELKIMINNIDANSSQGAYNDKIALANSFKIISDAFENIVNCKTQKKIEFVYPNSDGFTNEFRSLWLKYFRNLRWNELNAIDHFLKNGGIVSGIGKKVVFITTEKNKFHTNNLKTIIFDGTANHDPDYICQYDNFCFLDMDDYRSYENLIINTIDLNLSKTSIMMHENILLAVTNYIDAIATENTGVISYKSCGSGNNIIEVCKILSNRLKENPFIVLENGSVLYHGNSKGKNVLRNCTVLFLVGQNRYCEEDYAAKYLSIHGNIKKHLIEEIMNNNSASTDHFKVHRNGTFADTDLDNYRIRSMACDVIQNICRTKIRDFTDTKVLVNIYLFAPEHLIIKEATKYFHSCKLNHLDLPPELLDYKITSRKGNEIVEKILQYIDLQFAQSSDKPFVTINSINKKFKLNKYKWYYLYKRNPLFIKCLAARNIIQDRIKNQLVLRKT